MTRLITVNVAISSCEGLYRWLGAGEPLASSAATKEPYGFRVVYVSWVRTRTEVTVT